MTELEALEADHAVLAHDLDVTREELAAAYEQVDRLERDLSALGRFNTDLNGRVERLENSLQIFEFQQPDRIRLAKLEEAVRILAEHPGSPHFAARAAYEKLTAE